MFMADGNRCLKSLANIFNILFNDKLLEEYMLSLLVPNFKGKGNPFNPKYYRAIKLLEHAFNCMGRLWTGVCVRW